jgi:hypothetical protein
MDKIIFRISQVLTYDAGSPEITQAQGKTQVFILFKIYTFDLQIPDTPVPKVIWI